MLYRQGVGDIIQTLCHIHKSSRFYDNVYLFFDNSFIPPREKKSHNIKFPPTTKSKASHLLE